MEPSSHLPTILEPHAREFPKEREITLQVVQGNLVLSRFFPNAHQLGFVKTLSLGNVPAQHLEIVILIDSPPLVSKVGLNRIEFRVKA